MFKNPNDYFLAAAICSLLSFIFLIFQVDENIIHDLSVLVIVFACIGNVWRKIERRFDNIEKKLKN